jgi:hypothetical protein
VDTLGNILVTGGVSGTADFDGVLLGYGSTGIMMVKMSGADGSRVWAKCYDDLSDDYGVAVSVGAGNNILATGSFSTLADFGTGPMPSPGGFDGFVAKLTP